MTRDPGRDPAAGVTITLFATEAFQTLRQIKARYDPDNVFDQNFPIPPMTDVSRQETPTAG